MPARATPPPTVIALKQRMDALIAGKVAQELALDRGANARAAEELKLVVVELAMNAVRHARQGVCEIDISDGPTAVIRVEDCGPGFSAEVLADGGRTDAMAAHGPRDPLVRAPGLGSGLSAARRLCDELRLENRKGGGAVVYATKQL